jgi:lipid II:glycine glycyltransferase (peptidoglycan interpeptide bridge formation enzyme)
MRTCASYLVQWQILTQLAALGVSQYDLNGIDPVANPGVYHFKKGLAGRLGTEVTFAGHFQALEASLTNQSLLLVERLRRTVRGARSRPKVSA